MSYVIRHVVSGLCHHVSGLPRLVSSLTLLLAWRRQGFSALSAEAGDLTLEGDYLAAAANIFLNVATAGVALLARVKVELVLAGRTHAA